MQERLAVGNPSVKARAPTPLLGGPSSAPAGESLACHRAQKDGGGGDVGVPSFSLFFFKQRSLPCGRDCRLEPFFFFFFPLPNFYVFPRIQERLCCLQGQTLVTDGGAASISFAHRTGCTLSPEGSALLSCPHISCSGFRAGRWKGAMQKWWSSARRMELKKLRAVQSAVALFYT